MVLKMNTKNTCVYKNVGLRAEDMVFILSSIVNILRDLRDLTRTKS